MKTYAYAATLVMTCSSAALAAPSWQRTPTGIIVTPRSGPEKAVRLEVYGDRIVRVTESADASAATMHSLAVIASSTARALNVAQAGGSVVLSTSKVHASVDLATGRKELFATGLRNPNGMAWATDGEVLFHVPSMAEYGRLSRHSRDELVAGLRQSKYIDLLPAYNSISYMEGQARLAEGGVALNGDLVKAERVIITTGARPAVPALPGIDRKSVV